MRSDQELLDALIEGAKNSRYGKDLQHPDQPGSLTRFFTSVADENITAFCALLGAMIQHEAQTEPREIVEPPPYAEGRLQ
jgi:hypothetical protein